MGGSILIKFNMFPQPFGLLRFMLNSFCTIDIQIYLDVLFCFVLFCFVLFCVL